MIRILQVHQIRCLFLFFNGRYLMVTFLKTPTKTYIGTNSEEINIHNLVPTIYICKSISKG